MKKILASVLAVIMLAGCLTACDNSENSSNNSSDTSNSSASSNESNSSDSSSENSSSESENSSDAESSDTSTDSSSEASSDNSSATSENSGSGDRPSIDITDQTGYEYPDTRAGDIMMEILNTGDWAPMDVMYGDAVNAESLGWIFPNLDVSNFGDYCLATTIMSANLYKVVVAKAADGKFNEAKDSIEAYYNYIKTDPNALAYPSFEESVAGTVRNITDDGYFYVIVNPDGNTIEKAIK